MTFFSELQGINISRDIDHVRHLNFTSKKVIVLATFAKHTGNF
jgi:hypothetical protein